MAFAGCQCSKTRPSSAPGTLPGIPLKVIKRITTTSARPSDRSMPIPLCPQSQVLQRTQPNGSSPALRRPRWFLVSTEGSLTLLLCKSPDTSPDLLRPAVQQELVCLDLSSAAGKHPHLSTSSKNFVLQRTNVEFRGERLHVTPPGKAPCTCPLTPGPNHLHRVPPYTPHNSILHGEVDGEDALVGSHHRRTFTWRRARAVGAQRVFYRANNRRQDFNGGCPCGT